MSFAIAAAFTVRLLVMGADALTVDFLVVVVTPWAGVFRLATCFAAHTLLIYGLSVLAGLAPMFCPLTFAVLDKILCHL